MSYERTNTRVAIVGGARTPFTKAGKQFADYSAVELGTHAVDGVLELADLDPNVVDQLAFGWVILNPAVPHLARQINFKSNLEPDVSAVTLIDNCITGTSAIQSVYHNIVSGHAEVGIAGGVDSMSNPTVMFAPDAARIVLDASRARTLTDRLKVLAKLRPQHLKPWQYGIEEPSTGLTMGQHQEITVKEWGIGRRQQDQIAFDSHMKAHAGTKDGRLTAEIHPLNGVAEDQIIRADTTLDALASLKPVFDRSEAGTLTAGNSSALTDGAAATLLMSEHRAAELGYQPLAFIKDFINVGIDSDDGLLMGPGVAVPRLLAKNNLALEDIDIVEMHEAFAGQIATNLAAWEQGWKEPAIGTVDPQKLNPMGSSIAIGHPFAATGARIATTLANEMARRDSRYGLLSVCGAGSTAVAMLLERT